MHTPLTRLGLVWMLAADGAALVTSAVSQASSLDPQTFSIIVTALCGFGATVVSQWFMSRKDKMAVDLAIRKEQDEHQLKLQAQQADLDRQLAEMSERYIKTRSGDMKVMRGLLERNDFDQLKVMAHNMKGTGTTYGYPEITRLAADLERSTNEGSSHDLILEQLEALTATIKTSLANQK